MENGNWIKMSCRSLQRNECFFIVNVYGPVSMVEKRLLWQQIMDGLVNFRKGKGIIAGDFNATLNNEEKRGGSSHITNVQQDFQDFVDNNQLLDLQTKNGVFT